LLTPALIAFRTGAQTLYTEIRPMMLSDNEAVVAVTTVLTIATTVTTLGMAWLRRRPVNNAVSRGANDARLEEKIDQLQQSIEAIAVEVERVSEAQRFTAKILSERSNPQQLRGPGRSVTPH
jgi:hypothetical protein